MRLRRAVQILEVYYSNGTLLSNPVPSVEYFNYAMLSEHCAYDDYQWTYFLVERRSKVLIKAVSCFKSNRCPGNVYITFSGTKRNALWGSVSNYTAASKTSMMPSVSRM